MNRLRLTANLEHDRSELERRQPQLQARVRPGQRQHPIDESRHARCFGRDVRRGRAPHLITDGRPAREQAGVALDRGQRRAQLVRCVGDKPPLGIERVLQLFEHPVEARRKQSDLVTAAAAREPPAEIARAADLVGGARDVLQRLEGATGDQPGRRKRGDQGRNARNDEKPEHAGEVRPQNPRRLPRDHVAAAKGQREEAQALFGAERPANNLSRSDAKARRRDGRGTVQLCGRVNRRPARIEDFDENVIAGSEIRRGDGRAGCDAGRAVQ